MSEFDGLIALVLDGDNYKPMALTPHGWAPMHMQISGSSTPVVQSKTVAATGTPEALGAGSFNGIIRAIDSNTTTCYIGDAANQYAPMQPGDERPLITADLSKWYCKVGVNGEGVYLIGGA